jgi:uncharacterized OsmC-like protein
MTMQDVATALERAESVFRRRPQAGLHDDAPATASWVSGTRVVASHANGTRVETDMPGELGGSGDKVSPGWMFRAGIASCLTTCIAMTAALEGVELTNLEVRVGSRSDTRGLLGMADADGTPVYAGPGDMRLEVRIGAKHIAPEKLRALVEDSLSRSPMPNALRTATPLALQVDVDAG